MLAFATRRPLHGRQIGQLRHLAGQMKARLLLLPLVAGPAGLVVTPEWLVRAVLAARQLLPADTLRGPRAAGTARGAATPSSGRASRIARAYGATHLFTDLVAPEELGRGGEIDFPGSPCRCVSAGDWAYDPAAEVWRPLRADRAGSRARRPE